MDKDGLPFVGVPLGIALIFFFTSWWWMGFPFLAIAGFMIFFFRDPARVIPNDEGIVVSSADGTVTRIENRESGVFVSVFLSPLNVHLNRAPIAGTVSEVRMFKGLKRPATSNSASETNERNAITIVDGDTSVTCTQIVGILARRIVCRVSEGDALERGQKYGLIKFGSRTDLLMPSGSEVLVEIGQKVKGGETVIAKLPGFTGAKAI
ncbi:MAG: phosphatidylserine decarboxylase [Pyrinomonadaceae bacterium]